MQQVLFRGGQVIVEDVPSPRPDSGEVLVKVAWSCVSPGTELATATATSTSGLLGDFRRNPARVWKGLKAIHDQGLGTLRTRVKDHLTLLTASGYSCAGTVLESRSPGFAIGDCVACAGSGDANHAEFVAVPKNLVAKVPITVNLADACTVALGAIAVQGVRRSQAVVGEKIGVIGLGFVGQLTIQILKAAGCSVFGMDLDPAREEQAKVFGMDAAPQNKDPLNVARNFSDGYGLDAVLITAASTSDEPLYLAMQMARRKGRVVVVGDVGLRAKREAMYVKELDLLISTSYGPGRYDPSYEKGGLDYPYAYVRWTENRNMQAYLDLIASGRVVLGPLTARRVEVAEAAEAYQVLREETPRPYTVLLEYPSGAEPRVTRVVQTRSVTRRTSAVRLAILGAGSFVRDVHLPNLQKLKDRFQIEAVVTKHGSTALVMARQAGAQVATTDYQEVLANPSVDAVLIATRHHLHAEMVCQALHSRKHVFVEKPLAVTEEELQKLRTVVRDLSVHSLGCPVVFIGFNRRYSPYAARLRELVLKRSTPLQIIYRMNAGYMPPDHWVHGQEGGGRVLGEACHIFDLFRFLVGVPAVKVQAAGMHSMRRDVFPSDNFTATVRYSDGSVCTLLYTAQGSKSLPKEALELHFDGYSVLLDDYRSLHGFGLGVKLRAKHQAKGHCEELTAFHQAISGALDSQALWEEALEVTSTTLEVDRQVRIQ